jgi:hypothetical protein
MNRSGKINRKVWVTLATAGLLFIGFTKYFFYKNARALGELKSIQRHGIDFKSK